MVPREGCLPGLERRVQGQDGKAVIIGDVLLKTPGKGKLARTPAWLVGTIFGLAIRHLATPTCAPAVSLTPCLLAKPLLQKVVSEDGEEASSEPPSDGGISSRAPGALLVVLEMAADRGVSGRKVLYCTLTVPFRTSQPQQKNQSPAAHLQR